MGRGAQLKRPRCTFDSQLGFDYLWKVIGFASLLPAPGEDIFHSRYLLAVRTKAQSTVVPTPAIHPYRLFCLLDRCRQCQIQRYGERASLKVACRRLPAKLDIPG